MHRASAIAENNRAAASRRSPFSLRLNATTALSRSQGRARRTGAPPRRAAHPPHSTARARAVHNETPACPGAIGAPGSGRRIVELAADHRVDCLARHAARPQQADGPVEAGHDGRFDADLRRAAIEHRIDSAVEISQHMIGISRADPPRSVGRRSGDWPTDLRQQPARERMGRYAQADAVQARPGKVADACIPVRSALPESAGRARMPAPARSAASSNRPCDSADSMSATCEISGLKRGRSLAA